MKIWSRLLSTAALLGFTLLPSQAYAGLVGAGGTVQAFFYNGTLAHPAGLIPDGFASSDPAPLTVPLDFTNNVAETDIHVGDIQITLTNQVGGAAFCFLNTPGTACADQIDGFDFLFTGENILGVAVDPASGSSFQPVTGTFQGNTHLGLQLLSNNEIRVDLTGDLPVLNDQLILDVRFTPVAAPEPATLGLLGMALIGLTGLRRRKY